jgi:hypothetical protein
MSLYLDEEFDPTAHADQRTFDNVPPGTYVAEVTNLDIAFTKSGDGKMVVVQSKITEGEFENRVLFHNINIVNPSETAQRIGGEQLAALFKAVGHLERTRDLSVILNVPIRIKVKMGKARDGYEARSEIAAYLPLHDEDKSRPSTAPSAAQPGRPQTGAGSVAPGRTANAGGSKPSWMR